ncbi:helix-turn-helix domain-containing protein [Pseudomonas songnenensis]|uniref:helix-turn-helix domain-containing protein n=1 Tax=Pseudomonas songnenensis TaxID=1176259 RepID=UPI001F5D7399|nr:XRE family transcriptional regulator [Pseudomonas songnenensis]
MSDDTLSHGRRQYNLDIQKGIEADMTIAARLGELMKVKGWSEGELSRRSTVPQPTINRILSGESDSPRKSTVSKLARPLGVSPEWLLFGSGSANVGATDQPHREERQYPLISWVAAGALAESCDNFQPGQAEEFIESNENAGRYGYWLEVKGLSMVSPSEGPSFMPKMRILVQPEGFDVVSGKFYIAKMLDTGETTFKRYVRDAGVEYLEPLNPSFGTIRMSDSIVLIGRVIDAKLPKSMF